MTNHKWTEKEIESELRKMPVIENQINAEEIYQHVKLRKKTGKPFPWMPAAAGTAAAALMLILAPGLFNQDTPSSEQSSSDIALTTSEESNEESSQQEPDREESSEDQSAEVFDSSDAETSEENPVAEEEQDSSESNEADSEIMTVPLENENESGILFESDLSNNQYFEAGLITEDAYVIPFTIVVSDDDQEQSAAALYQQWADKIDEQAQGFIEYHPVSSDISEEENNLTGMINGLENKTQGASAAILIDVLRETFGSFYDEFRIIDENNETAQVGEFGAVESYSLKNDQRGFYIYENEDGSYYYVKSYEDFNTPEEALFAIEEQNPNDRYSSPVPENIDIQSEVAGNEMMISFDGETNELSEEDRRQLVESILLTAESFSIATVLFENLDQDFLEGYDFANPITVPIGANTAYLQ
ncbi:hypothetical protein [Jeotgalibacillus salarius]|uniref:GerMN domain-containing protein n=1 Tax=Jeotgalibacillus salarius TaxID=546023 RepID=A0A4Y8LKL1_9BACL|nr:hypothetical protein [Jeotgalibacillus salarius]TFE03115.1 hypothetical protein E2626_04695 [Jeotgalibacillus salarius]